tara:strand:+ start:728 stop:2098 length:1371 start_codon:yes stop_codon:yes gene_type:complete
MKSGDSHMELIDRYLSGQATPKETAQLESRMIEDPQLRTDFLAYARLDVALPEAMGGNPALVEVQATPLPPRSWKRWVPTAIAAVLLIGAIVTSLVMGERGSTSATAEPQIVARFGELKNCRWMASDTKIETGDSLRSGQRIELSAGTAQFIFNTGAQLELVGPAIVEARSENGVFLTLGEAHLVAETPESKGFTVETPSSTFVDISTAFSTAVSPDGLSRLQVTDGEVDVVLDGVKRPKRLKEGQTLFVEPGDRKIITRIESGDGTSAFRFPTIEPPSREDYADQSQGHARVSVASGNLETQVSQSEQVTVLLDGKGQPRQDAPDHSAFFNGKSPGSFLLDLGEAVPITRINSYSWHQNNRLEEHRERAQQIFTIYGYAGDEPLDPNFPLKKAGWTRIARVNSETFFNVTERLDRPAQQASSITAAQGDIGKFRYLLWETRKRTFYGEFDVFVAP